MILRMKRSLFICFLILLLAFSTVAAPPEQSDAFVSAQENTQAAWSLPQGVLRGVSNAIRSEQFRMESKEHQQRLKLFGGQVLVFLFALRIILTCRHTHRKVLCFKLIRSSDTLLETHLGRFPPFFTFCQI